jgi:hypothetical protein
MSSPACNRCHIFRPYSQVEFGHQNFARIGLQRLQETLVNYYAPGTPQRGPVPVRTVLLYTLAGEDCPCPVRPRNDPAQGQHRRHTHLRHARRFPQTQPPRVVRPS